ncbi:MAG: FecR family protein [Flavobacteriaceae bacterium]|nr:FecR family protein [Flavobacteriaceae bacterium]
MEKQNSNSNDETFLANWLEGKISDAELKNRISEADYSSYLKMRKGFEVSNQLNASIKDSFNKIKDKTANKKTTVRKLHPISWSIGVAASIILLFGLFSIFTTDLITHKTNFGETKTISLLDGSEVILNSKSTITFNEVDWKENRQLTLDGEAYFKVEKGSTFTVNTNNGSVVVLGTQFNVNSKDDFFDVVCYEGKVSVNSNSLDYILLPTNSFRKINESSLESSTTQLSKPTWIDGESTFKSVPIKYVITALEDQYNIKIDSELINDSTIFSGSFPHENLNIALITVFDALKIRYNQKEKRKIKLRY